MPKRTTVRADKFGAWLQLRRGKRTLEQVAQRIRILLDGVQMAVPPSLIHKFERGRVPGWPVLAAYARLYDVSMTEILTRLVDAIEFAGASDLLRHERTQPSGLPAEAGVPVEARLRELLARAEKAEEEREYYRRIIELAGNHVSAAGDVLRRAIPPTPGEEAPRRRSG